MPKQYRTSPKPLILRKTCFHSLEQSRAGVVESVDILAVKSAQKKASAALAGFETSSYSPAGQYTLSVLAFRD